MSSSAQLSLANYVFLFLPPFFWSTNFIIGKALVGSVPPWTLNTGRFSVSAIILLPLLLYRGGWHSVPRQYIPILIVMGLTGVTAFNSVLYIGLHHTSVINATLVNSTTPVTTACLAWILIGERMHWRHVLGIVLSFAGVGWIVARGDLEVLFHLRFNAGDLIVFFATVLWGFYSVMAKDMMRALSPFTLTAITTVIGTIFLFPASFLELSTQNVDLAGVEVMLAFAYLGVFPSFVAFLLWNRSILTFGPGRAALVYNTIPLYATVLSVFFLGETLMPYQVVGGLGIVMGVIIGTSEGGIRSERNL